MNKEGRISVRLTPLLRKKVGDVIAVELNDDGSKKTPSQVIRTALKFWLDNREEVSSGD